MPIGYPFPIPVPTCYDGAMIAGLRGVVTGTGKGFLVIEVGGISYKVYATEDTVTTALAGTEISVVTYLVVRENALELFGFKRASELHFFELLLEVPGIGPRSALNILGLADVSTLREAIASKNANYLTRVSGIGKKNAEKIVITLQDKVAKGDDAFDMEGETEALEALHSLGYSQKEARQALEMVPREVTGTGDRIREALKMLAK
jgi:Holliday junction DNA helicase RuvA